MRRTVISASLGVAFAACALAVPSLAAADQAPPITANVTLTSQYIYRGIAQTRGKPAIQGGFDYANPSGFYVGTWGSSISWLSDGTGANAPTEIDVYGGYKGSITKDLGFNVGVLTYNYPGTGLPSGAASPDTVELYGAVSYAWLTAKYSVTTGTSLFGWTKNNLGTDKTSGSGYFQLDGSWDLGSGFGLTAHAGHQTVNGYGAASYSDWNVGVTKALAGGTLGLLYSDTNANGCPSGPYCNTIGTDQYDLGKGALVVSFSKSF